MNSPTVRLAHIVGAQGDNTLVGRKGVPQMTAIQGDVEAGEEAEIKPALLVSFFYIESWLEKKEGYFYRDWALDSGAFSAAHRGAEIDHNKFIDTALRLLETDPALAEVFSLDVIGDHEASARNVEEEWRQGLKSVPAFHPGEPEAALRELADRYPKIAIGGVAKLRPTQRRRFVAQVFARVWPKRIHGFGISDERTLMGYPFHSVDSTSWELGPCGFANWRAYGKLSVKGSSQDLRVEVEWYLDLERKLRRRWKKEMKRLEALDDNAPVIRLAVQSGSPGVTGTRHSAIKKKEEKK